MTMNGIVSTGTHRRKSFTRARMDTIQENSQLDSLVSKN